MISLRLFLKRYYCLFVCYLYFLSSFTILLLSFLFFSFFPPFIILSLCLPFCFSCLFLFFTPFPFIPKEFFLFLLSLLCLFISYNHVFLSTTLYIISSLFFILGFCSLIFVLLFVIFYFSFYMQFFLYLTIPFCHFILSV